MKEDALHDLTPASASVTVAVTSVVRVAVTPVVRMTMSGPAVLEDEDAHEVDQETEDGYHQQPLVLHLGRLDQPLHSLGENKERDKEQEEAVDEACEGLCPDVSEAVLVVCFPLCDHCGHQARQQTCKENTVQ